MRIFNFAVVALLSATLRLSATHYYIDYSNGADGNDGMSAGSAWRHCPGDPAATERAAAAALGPGDVVRFKGGVTYVLTTAPGIELRWDGAADRALVYDGNSDGTWGTGRARFTDHHSDKGMTAFSATGLRRHLVLRGLDIGPIGGAAQPPADPGSAVAARYGGGIAFAAGVENTTVERCSFRELGYWFNQRPMSAASIAGAGIAAGGSVDLRVSDCSFARVAIACDFRRASRVDQTRVVRSSFGEAIVWPIDAPPALQGASSVQVSESEVAADAAFARGAWLGYGEAPQTMLKIAGTNSTVTWTVSAIGSPAPTFQWSKNGVPLPGATSATLRLSGVTMLDSGIYTAVATNSAGSTVSNTALLVVMPQFLLPLDDLASGSGGGTTSPTPEANVAPSFTLQPVNQLVTRGESVTLNVAAAGTPLPTLQWLRNGAPLAGATGAALVLPSVTTSDAGNYTAVATNVAGTATSGSATLTVLEPAPPPPPPPPSSQEPTPVGTMEPAVLAATLVTAGETAANVEFTVSGTAPRAVLVRAVGPTLSAFRLVSPLADPRLEIHRDGARVGENDNWGGDAAVRNAAGAATLFPLTDGTSADAAVVLTLAPGNYRAVISSKTGASGVVWVDAYALP